MEFCEILDFFISFLKKLYEENKFHKMFSLMLNLRFKSFFILFSFVERKQGVVIVEEDDRKSLYPMMLKCHEHFHPLIEFQRIVVN